MEKLIAKLGQNNVYNGINLQDKKECVRTISIIVNSNLSLDDLKEIIDVRFYMGRSKQSHVVECSLWVRDELYSVSGYGKAKGYGYDKYSAALDNAIESAGIKLSRSIDGTGRSVDALLAIVDALGYNSWLIVDK